jgi:hypothetical protein
MFLLATENRKGTACRVLFHFQRTKTPDGFSDGQSLRRAREQHQSDHHK